MAQKKRSPYPADALIGAAPEQPSLLLQAGSAGLSGLSAVGNLLDLPGSMVRDTIAGASTGNWSKHNPLDNLLTPFSDKNRTTGRELNRMGGLAGSKDTYGNWWGGLGTEIAADPLTYLGGLGVAKRAVGALAAKAGLHGQGLAKVATAASRAGKVSGLGPAAVRAGKTSWLDKLIPSGIDWVGPREANLITHGGHVQEFAPEMFKMLESTAQAQKGGAFDLASHMDRPFGALAKFWPAGEAGLIGTGKTGQKIARGLDVAGDIFRNFKIPGTNLRPVAGVTNSLWSKAGKAVNAEDLQTAYHKYHVQEGGRYEHRLWTAKWKNDLERLGHSKTAADTVRHWFEFPDKAPAELHPLVQEVRKYIDRIPQIAGELGVKIGDVTEKMRAAGSMADYWPRFLAENLTGNKKYQSFGKMFDPAAASELSRLEWGHGARRGTLDMSELFKSPEVATIKAPGPAPTDEIAAAMLKDKHGLRIDPTTGEEIGFPATFLDAGQIASLKKMGIEPTVDNALKLIKQLKGTRTEDFIKFKELLVKKGNLSKREADAMARTWKSYAEGYRGEGLGDTLDKLFKGQGFKFNQTPGQYGSVLFQEGKQVPTFYSKLAQVAEQKVGGKIDQNQLLAMLKNNGVKDEEIIDMGIQELFPLGQKTISKQELMDHLHENAVELKEVTKGGTEASKRMHELEAIQAGGRALNENEYRELESIYSGEYGPRESTKFSAYKTPGGENYRELLMTMPPKEIHTPYGTTHVMGGKEYVPGSAPQFKSGHWDEPNVLAHVRFQDHTDAASKKVLLIDEIQSDWHQAGRKAGYDDPGRMAEASEKLKAIRQEQNDVYRALQVDYRNAEKAIGEAADTNTEWYARNDFHQLDQIRSRIAGIRGQRKMTFSEAISDLSQSMKERYADLAKRHDDLLAREQQLADVVDRGKGAVPDAPFKKSWHTLAMKRMIRHAAENGYDKVAWTKGADQADRYDLSKQISRISWVEPKGKYVTSGATRVVNIEPHNGPVIALDLDSSGKVVGGSGLPDAIGKQLDDVIGKEHAEKIMSASSGKMSGEGLRIGGEGMKGFYDNILPNDTNKIIKKHGARVGELRIPGVDLDDMGRRPRDLDYYEMPGKGKAFHSFDITPSMREEALGKGQPLYQGDQLGLGIKGATEFEHGTGKAIIHSFHNTDISTHLHEMSHVMRRNLTAADQKIADAFVGATGAWTTAHEETFSRGFERYMREGFAPNKHIAGLFSRLKKLLVNIYQHITGSQIDVNLTPEIKELYGRLVGGPPPGGAKRAGQFAPNNTFLEAAKTIKDMSPEALKAGVYANHPVNDFAASMSSTMDKLHASKIALERMADAAVPAGEGTVPMPVVLKGLDLEFGDGQTKGAIKWLKDHGVADPENAHLPADTAKFLTQMGDGWRGGPKEVSAAAGLYDDFSKVMKSIFTNMDPVRYNVRNRVSGLFSNWIAGLVNIFDGSGSDAKSLMRGTTIQGAAKNPHLLQMAAERGIQNLDDKQATQMLGEIMYALETEGSFGVAHEAHVTGHVGGQLSDIGEQIPGTNPFTWGGVANKAMGGFGTSGTTWNPISSIRGVAGAEKTKFALPAAGEQISKYTEGLNRIAPVWAMIQDGVHPVEAARRAMEAQVDYRSRNYTEFERQVLKRIFLFYSFAKGQFPFSVNQLLTHPGGKLAQTLRTLNRGKGEDELVPQHVAETASIPVPELPGMKPLEQGAKRYLTGFGLGFEEPAQFAVPSAQNFMMESASRFNPLIKAPLEMMSGQSFFQRSPGGYGRALEDLDPVLGRTLANIGQMTGLQSMENKAPVRYPGSGVIEHILSNSPLSTVFTKARTVTDPRKGPVAKASNLLSGFKMTDVSPAQQDKELRGRVAQIEKQMGGRQFSTSYVPKDVQAGMTEKEKKQLAQLEALKKLLEARSKERKKK